MTDQPARDTVHAAAHDAERFLRYARRELGAAESALEGQLHQAAQLHATTAVAESSCAIAAELRALRLMLAQQLPALRPGR